MGILGLSKLIGDFAASAVKEFEMKNLFGRKIAIDASMSIYQFLIAVRQEGNVLTNADGETTSHLMGIFYRTIRMVENGIKPVYVFDGKPPEMKSGEVCKAYNTRGQVIEGRLLDAIYGHYLLAKRQERRSEAQKSLEKATEDGNVEDVDKFSRRLVKVTRQHNDECKQLLKLMGMPYVEAPCEAEAQCAALVKAEKVYGVATEDMDGLTFGAGTLLRHMTFSEARKMPIKEFRLSRILEELGFTQEQFIDLCILLGCDYCDSIRGIGPKRAVELIRLHGDLEGILKKIDRKKYPVPEDWPYEEVRLLFKEPEVTDPKTIDLKWTDPDEEGLIAFLCNDKGFSEDRVRNGTKKLLKGRTGQTQGRLDNFFKVVPGVISAKRKADDKSKPAKKAKGGGGRGRKPK